jgi:thiol:disulfide interchange protein
MNATLWQIFSECFVLGLVAFTLPCIFPLAPLTISFFTKKAEASRSILPSAFLYAASIITIYVALGLLMTLLFGAGALNELASNGLFNIFIFCVLLFFGASLLGAFELNLPHAFVNIIANKSHAHGVAGIFFMAATLAVVSFSCTGPLIGTILVTVGVTGSSFAPAVGMLGFSSALAGIFFVFAIFPHWLKFLPKSGSWLNTVKVSLGFIEIALAFKFLSTADMAYHWNLLSRELFLEIWILLSLLLALNILGKLRLAHDSALASISIPRYFFAACAFGFSLFLLSGLWGDKFNSLTSLSGFLPPMRTPSSEITSNMRDNLATKLPQEKKKYNELFHMPHKIDGYFDYDQALAFAQRVHKPLLLDFTGHGCVNCRKMEAEVWSDPRVLSRLKEQFIVVSLYTDDKTALPEADQFFSAILKTQVNTVGKKFKHLQAERYQTLSQPYYVLLNTKGEALITPPIGVELDIDNYVHYLDTGLAAFAKTRL